jgi:hypothetical protein
VTPVEFVRPVGGKQQDADAAQRPYEERDKFPGGLVGPVQVLEDKHQRLAGTEPAQQAEDQLEQLSDLAPARGGIGFWILHGPRVKLGQQPSEAAPGRPEYLCEFRRRRGPGQRAQRVDERGQRQALRA